MIGKVQEHLEAIYGLERKAPAESFVVDGEQAALLGATGRSDEELLVLEGEGELELALYFAPRLLERIGRHRDMGELARNDLDSYCRLTEGVSHFVYLINAATQDRKVSLLELEAQAEIDKFASRLLHQWGEGVSLARELLGSLFDRVRFHESLSSPERWRYEEANRLAKNYCRRLMPHVVARNLDRFLAELRYSYRLGAEAKLQYLAALTA